MKVADWDKTCKILNKRITIKMQWFINEYEKIKSNKENCNARNSRNTQK